MCALAASDLEGHWALLSSPMPLLSLLYNTLKQIKGANLRRNLQVDVPLSGLTTRPASPLLTEPAAIIDSHFHASKHVERGALVLLRCLLLRSGLAGAPKRIKWTLTHSAASIASEVEWTAAGVVLLTTDHTVLLMLLRPLLLLLIANHTCTIASTIPWLHGSKLILTKLLLLLVLLHLPILLLLTIPRLELAILLSVPCTIHALAAAHLPRIGAKLATHLACISVHVLLTRDVALHEHWVRLELGLFSWLLLLLLLVELSWLVLVVLWKR